MIFNPGLVPQGGSGGGAVVGTYTGDGSYLNKFTLEFDVEPALVIIRSYHSSYTWETIAVCGADYASATKQESSKYSLTSIPISWEGRKVTFTVGSMSVYAVNGNNFTYNYVVIPKA